MQEAIRPRLTAGVALVGASIIIGAIVAPPPSIRQAQAHLPSVDRANVDLASVIEQPQTFAQLGRIVRENLDSFATYPIPHDLLQRVIASQVDGATALAQSLQTVGGEIGNAIFRQSPAALETAVEQLASGNVPGAVNTLLTIPGAFDPITQHLLDIVHTILTKQLETLTNVVSAFTSDPTRTRATFVSLISPFISTPGAIVTAMQNVVSALGTGDATRVLDAVANAPVIIADGVLDGGYGPDLRPFFDVVVDHPAFAGGLITAPTFYTGAPSYEIIGGPVSGLLDIYEIVGNAIAPTAESAPTAPTAPTAETSESAPTAETAAARPVSVSARTATLPTLPNTPSAKAVPDVSSDTLDAKTIAVSTDTASVLASSATSKTVHPADALASKDPTEGTTSSTPSSKSTDVSTIKKPMANKVEETTGNKVEPKTKASDAAKSGDSATAIVDQDGTDTSRTTSPAAADSASRDGSAS